MTEKPAAEEYVYHIGKIRFIVTPVYKETGELMRDILLKLMLETSGHWLIMTVSKAVEKLMWKCMVGRHLRNYVCRSLN